MSVKNHEIAQRLKTIRELSDVTVSWLAERVGMSESDYAALENGEVDIAVSLLYEVCSVLKISMTELLTGEPAKLKVYSLVRKGKGIDVERNSAYKYQDLAYSFFGRKIEPLYVTVEPTPEDSQIIPQAHQGHEYHYCLEGSYKMVIGKNEMTVNEGDSLYFDSKYAHGMKAMGGKPAKILVIVI